MLRRLPSAFLPSLFLLLLAVGVVFLLASWYGTYFSPEARLAGRNGLNIRAVRVGMDTAQVGWIMGPPETISRFERHPAKFIYHYRHRPGTSDSYQITISRHNQVSAVSIIDDQK